MAVLQLKDKQYLLSEGTIRIGAGADADVVFPTDAALGVQAVIEHTGDHAIAIRRAAPQSQVRVNGVLLGAGDATHAWRQGRGGRTRAPLRR